MSSLALGRQSLRQRNGRENTALPSLQNGKLGLSQQLPGKGVRKAFADVSNTQTVQVPGKGMVKKTAKPVEDATEKRVTRSSTHTTTDLLPVDRHVASCETSKPMDVAMTGVAVAFSEMCHIEDIDAGDTDNPQLCTEYVNEIYHYMRVLERKYSVSSSFLSSQREVTGYMRTILVDWLIQVHLRFKLLQETLYVAIAIMDRYLSMTKVARQELQLVGVTSMLLASKYEEIFAPEVEDFVFVTDNAYTGRQIRAMEGKMLNILGFELGKPFCLQFLRRNSKAGQADAMMHTVGKYLMELTLQEMDMVHELPSTIAAASLYVTMKLLRRGTWSQTLQYYSGYSEVQVLPCAMKLAGILKKTATEKKLTAVRAKYSSEKFLAVSALPELQPSHIDRTFSLLE